MFFSVWRMRDETLNDLVTRRVQCERRPNAGLVHELTGMMGQHAQQARQLLCLVDLGDVAHVAFHSRPHGVEAWSEAPALLGPRLFVAGPRYFAKNAISLPS